VNGEIVTSYYFHALWVADFWMGWRHDYTKNGDSTRIKDFAAESHLLYCLPC